MSDIVRQIDKLSQNAETLLHETWELFARLRATNEELIRQTDDIASKLNALSRDKPEEEAA